jgi:hypothetical protein
LKRSIALASVGAIGVVLAALAFAHTVSRPKGPYVYAVTPALGDGWTTGSVEQVGIDRHRIEAMTDLVRGRPDLNVHAVLIERGGRLVYEEHFSGTDERWGRPLSGRYNDFSVNTPGTPRLHPSRAAAGLNRWVSVVTRTTMNWVIG